VAEAVVEDFRFPMVDLAAYEDHAGQARRIEGSSQ
jgi:hypothetical protein